MNGSALLKVFSGADMSVLKLFKKETMGAGVLIVLTIFFYRFAYQRNASEIRSLDTRIKETRAEIDKINAEIQTAENLRKAVTAAARELKRADESLKHLNERLPSGKQISKILSEISDNDLKGGVRILAIKPLPPEETGELIRLPFQITMETRFIPFGEYLERIEGLKRLMIVDNFLIESKEDPSNTLTAQLYLSAYILGLSH